MATINGKSVNVEFDGINGFNLNDLNYHTPAEYKQAIKNAQDAVKALMDMFNGENGELTRVIERPTYDFYRMISRLCPDVPNTEVRGYGYSYVKDFSDVPFIRTMDDDCCYGEFKVTPIE